MTDEERRELTKLISNGTTERRLAERTDIILIYEYNKPTTDALLRFSDFNEDDNEDIFVLDHDGTCIGQPLSSPCTVLQKAFLQALDELGYDQGEIRMTRKDGKASFFFTPDV